MLEWPIYQSLAASTRIQRSSLRALLGDTSCAVFIPAGVDRSTQAGVAHELLGSGEARDVAGGSENRQGDNQAEAGQLEQERYLIGPGLWSTVPIDFLLDLCEQLIDVIDGG